MAAIGILWGGPKCYRRRRFKDFMIFFEWFDPEKMEVGQGEPTLVITRAHRFALSGNRGSVLIPLNAAYKYADSKSGGPTRWMAEFAVGACHELGLEPSPLNAHKIIDAVVEHLPDLLRMPPAPHPDKFASRQAAPAGELEVLVDGKTVLETGVH